MQHLLAIGLSVAFAAFVLGLYRILRAKPVSHAADRAYLANRTHALVAFDRMRCDSFDTDLRRHEIRMQRICNDPTYRIARPSNLITQCVAPDYLRAVQRTTPFQF